MKAIAYLSALILSCNSVSGQLSEKAASTIIDQVNTLTSDYTETIVAPTDGKEGVIVVSMKALQTDKVRKLWTFIAATMIGKYYNDNPKLSVKEIWFSDIQDMKASPVRYSVLDVSTARTVQSKIYAGEMELEDGINKVWTSLVQKTKELKKIRTRSGAHQPA